jgi:hypothetical protein
VLPLLVSAALLAACSSDDAAPDGAGSSDGPSTASTPPVTAAPGTSATIAPEPTGVPGLDDDDPFCADWAHYAGTVQVLSVAASFGDLDGAGVTRLEVAAAPALVTTIGALAAGWPDEIAAERDTVLAGSMGGWRIRSGAVVDVLQANGVGVDQLAGLGLAWTDVLAGRDPDDPVPDLDGYTTEQQAVIDAQAPLVLDTLGVFTADASLRRDPADAPATRAYLAANCPDLAASGVGDAI